MITLKNIFYIVGKAPSKFELNISHLEVEQGEVIALIGENGSGKTTLIDILVGNLRPQQGTLNFVNKENDFKISAIFQDSHFDEITIKETLNFFKSANNSDVDIDELLLEFGLFEFKSKRFNELSFGQKQRFRFVVTLVKPFSILILDEVMTGIDLLWRRKIRKVIAKIVELGKTVFIISHDIEDITNFCSRVIFLENGKIKADFKLNGTVDYKRQTLLEKVKFLDEALEEEKL
ncbi:ATP-binding cassette domain-containing protein [Mesoplasma seiffertii]|uniref:ATP-binding cassette domain-containing protein n=1 Tax=Mesoplasma seiffertii TaxID=28224 RepID=UPI00146FBD57|nr:ABC transporter ATP-binding protein [Mesoplasma seiffertii]